MDEKSMILEQERQEKAKKRKKRKKFKIAFGILAVLVIAGGIFYLVKGRELLAASQSDTVEIVAEEGQTICYAQIVSIYGNEITYVETEIPQISAQTEEDGEDASDGRGEKGEFNGEMPEGFGGEMPEGFDMENFEGFDGGSMPGGGSMPDGSMPDMGGSGGRGASRTSSDGSSRSGRPSDEMPEGFSGEMPEGEMPEGFGGEMPSGEMTGGFDSERQPGGFGGGSENGRPQASEQITAYIPVGTEVITKLGTSTTFSRLAAGDYVALIMEEDEEEQVIMKVYIVG